LFILPNFWVERIRQKQRIIKKFPFQSLASQGQKLGRVNLFFMLTIRFLRLGKKHQPLFRIVVTDKKNPPQGGRFIEILGFYNPLTKEKQINKERVGYWMKVGAEPSDTVFNFLIKEKIIEGKKRNVVKISKNRLAKINEKKQEEEKKKEEAKQKEQAATTTAATEAQEKPVEPEKPVETTEEKSTEPKAEPKE
jgi:small subunit ribosomal protein S16